MPHLALHLPALQATLPPAEACMITSTKSKGKDVQGMAEQLMTLHTPASLQEGASGPLQLSALGCAILSHTLKLSEVAPVTCLLNCLRHGRLCCMGHESVRQQMMSHRQHHCKQVQLKAGWDNAFVCLW